MSANSSINGTQGTILLARCIGGLLLGCCVLWAASSSAQTASSARDAAVAQLTGVPAGGTTGIALGFHTYIRRGHKGDVVDYSPIAKLGDKLGHHPALVQGFYPWKNADGSYCPFPQEFADYAVSQGATPLITWQPGQVDNQNHVERPQADWTCVEIASDRDDQYIRDWAAAVKAYPHPVYVRLMHEFNATPYPWAYGLDHVKNSPANYVAAFRHVVRSSTR